MSEWTPTDDEAASMFITGWCCDTDPETGKTQPDEAWNRWLAAHDRALREQIARDIDAERDRFVTAFPDDPTDYESDICNRCACIARGDEQTDE